MHINLTDLQLLQYSSIQKFDTENESQGHLISKIRHPNVN